MPAGCTDPHGDFLPALIWHGIADRVAGRVARANGRWGRVSPPPGRGRVLWILSGAARDSVRLGVAVAQAVREKRLDLRIVLTFEREHPDLIEPLSRLRATGSGFAPCDHPRALSRAFRRIDPFALIFAGTVPRPNLARMCPRASHVLAVGAGRKCEGLAVERVYPADEQQSASWQGSDAAPAAQLLTLVAWGQAEPNFRALAAGGEARHLWYWRGASDALARVAGAFRESLREDLLFVDSGDDSDLSPPEGVLPISAWRREPFPAGAVIWVDEERWLPVLTASCSGCHFDSVGQYAFWQALAGGGAVSRGAGAVLPRRALADAVTDCPDPAAIMAHWTMCRSEPARRRALGDAARRAFWNERRLAQEVADELLERVFEWN